MEIGQNPIRSSVGQGDQSCEKWKKSENLFQIYHVNKSLQPAGRSGSVWTSAKT